MCYLVTVDMCVCVCVNNLPKIINRERYAVTETIKLLFTGSV